MRVEFSKALISQIEHDPRAIFLTGDLGFSAFEPLMERFPKQFLNAGVAEQNMIGVSAGLALSGLHPWVYSIVPFITYRCLEQVRNDLCLHRLPVRLVGNGGGYTYGVLGATHYALEDLGVLKGLPGIELYFPGTGDQVETITAHLSSVAGPTYLRLGFSPYATTLPVLSENPRTFTRHYARGKKLTLIGVGQSVQTLLYCLKNLGLSELDAAVFGLAKFPLDLDADTELSTSVRETGQVLVVEEHFLAGSIAESLKFALPANTEFRALTARYSKDFRYGSPAFMHRQTGIDPESVMREIRVFLNKK